VRMLTAFATQVDCLKMKRWWKYLASPLQDDGSSSSSSPRLLL